jgi:hypothetical protein
VTDLDSEEGPETYPVYRENTARLMPVLLEYLPEWLSRWRTRYTIAKKGRAA